MIAPAVLAGAALVAWGFPPARPALAPPAPPPPPAAVAPAAPAAPAAPVPAPVPPPETADVARQEEALPPTTPAARVAPNVTPNVTSPAVPPASQALPSAEIITPLGKRKKKRDGQNGAPGVEGEEPPRFGTVEIKGRVFVLGELQRGNVTVFDPSAGSAGFVTRERNAFDINVASIRPLLRWQAPQKWLSGVIEFELTGKPDLRDGYVQARKKDFLLRAGQFKMPGSAIEMASPWTLPFVRRGFLHGLLVDELDNAWRRPGVMARWRGTDVFLRPEISAGIFQGVVLVSDVDRDKDPIIAQSLSAQSLIGRAQIEPAHGLEVGAHYNHRVGTPGLFRTDRYWTAGADIVVDRTFASGGLRIWLDGIAGASWFEHASKPPDDKNATFVSGRSIVALRFGGLEVEHRYLEAYGTFGVLDPDTTVVSDLAVEAAVGLNVGLWQRFRITAQGEIWRTGRNFPASYFPPQIDPDRIAALLQVGVNL